MEPPATHSLPHGPRAFPPPCPVRASAAPHPFTASHRPVVPSGCPPARPSCPAAAQPRGSSRGAGSRGTWEPSAIQPATHGQEHTDGPAWLAEGLWPSPGTSPAGIPAAPAPAQPDCRQHKGFSRTTTGQGASGHFPFPTARLGSLLSTRTPLLLFPCALRMLGTKESSWESGY